MYIWGPPRAPSPDIKAIFPRLTAGAAGFSDTGGVAGGAVVAGVVDGGCEAG